MIDYKTLYNTDAFDKSLNRKNKWFLKNQKKLSLYHYENSKEYRVISDNIFKPISKVKEISELPFIHASAFKNYNIKSIQNNKFLKIFNSSGTSNQKKSQINIDPKTSILQSRALGRIFSNLIDKQKDIFLLEKKNFLNTKEIFSAKGAAINGFSQLSKKKYFLLDRNGRLNLSILKNYIIKNPKKEFIIFGFTSSIWNELILKIRKKKIKFKSNKGILVHGGGWKKMNKLKVNNNRFKTEISNVLGIKKIYNYYGMIEQTGSVFLECEKGYYHSSIFSDILIRNSKLELSEQKEIGLIQILSLLPLSYPGHNILTEDLGKIEGFNNCKCGRGGKYFKVIGRVKNTELRGCSDAI